MNDQTLTDRPSEVIVTPTGSSVPETEGLPSSPTKSSTTMDNTSNAAVSSSDNAMKQQPSTSGNVSGVVIGLGIGRIKEKPVCNVPALRKENMSAGELSQFCFKPEQVLMDQSESPTSVDNDVFTDGSNEDDVDCDNNGAVEGEPSKIETRHGHGSNDNGNGNNGDIHDEDTEKNSDNNLAQIPIPILKTASPKEWASFKQSILLQTESRNGRDLQRFATGTNTRSGHQLFRLTSGSVPIMSDGRILLVSSSRKEEWILPKGGWESDESLEVSALRETYEEGGILGVLGPRLTNIEYEPRKAKKRRLELESLKKKYEIAYGSGSDLTNGSTNTNTNLNTVVALSAPSTDSSICPSEEGDNAQSSSHSTTKDLATVSIVTSTTRGGNVSEYSFNRDDTASLSSIASVASDGSGHGYSGYIRMSMFPLYVMEVRENWPESGRARKVVDIDTAIDLMASRPEFHKVLTEVKEKGYHLRPHGGGMLPPQSESHST